MSTSVWILLSCMYCLCASCKEKRLSHNSLCLILQQKHNHIFSTLANIIEYKNNAFRSPMLELFSSMVFQTHVKQRHQFNSIISNQLATINIDFGNVVSTLDILISCSALLSNGMITSLMKSFICRKRNIQTKN